MNENETKNPTEQPEGFTDIPTHTFEPEYPESGNSLSEQFIDLIKTKYGDDEVSPILQYLSKEGFWKDNSFTPDTETKIKEAIASGKYDLAGYVDDFHKDVEAEHQEAEDNKSLSEQFIDLIKSKYGDDEVSPILQDLSEKGFWKDDSFDPELEAEIKEEIESGKFDLTDFVENIRQTLHEYDMDDAQDEEEEESEYPTIESEIKKRFANNPEDCETILDTFKKALASKSRDQWVAYIEKTCKKGEDKASIQTKLIPQLVKIFNKHNSSSQIDLPQRTAATDLGKNVTIMIPEDMNKPPVDFSDKPVFKQCGVPMINFSSNILRAIRKEHDKNHLKVLLKEFIKVAEKTDIANALGKFVWLGKRSNVYKILQGIANAKTVPVMHSTLIAWNDPKGFATDLKSDVIVNKVDEAADDLTESVSVLDYGDVLTEGIFDFIHGKRTEGSTKAIGTEFDIPRSYLRQFYDVVDPSSQKGWVMYSKLMNEDATKQLKELVEKDAKMIEQVKNSNLPVKQALFKAYAAMNNGIPFFYVFTPKASLNERIQISQKPLLNNMYVVKSVSNGKSIAYFVTKEQKENWFEIS